ncbi:Protein dennd6a [Clydaea vesicula]|uniref:Protein dennd6a n=1 Tax=Clydaea vesicula TaxID=447962 RepID=A0AAD5U272_9FUNG|nr:Protein dennd6a [Clydaea vesicula]
MDLSDLNNINKLKDVDVRCKSLDLDRNRSVHSMSSHNIQSQNKNFIVQSNYTTIPLNDIKVTPRKKTIVRSDSAAHISDNLTFRSSITSNFKSEVPNSLLNSIVSDASDCSLHSKMHKTNSSPSLVLQDSPRETNLAELDKYSCKSTIPEATKNNKNQSLIADLQLNTNDLQPKPIEKDTSMLSNQYNLESKTEKNFVGNEKKLSAFWQWALCFCVVNFDLEVGQALECVYPKVYLTDTEQKNISFSAFPDSNSSAHVGDSNFSFRMRNGPYSNYLYKQSQPEMNTSPQTSPKFTFARSESAAQPILFESKEKSCTIPIDSDGYCYGYVFFRQQSNSEIRRGFFQKSLVILSPHPWRGLFLLIVKLLGAKVMDCLIADRNSYSKKHSECSSEQNLGGSCLPGTTSYELLVKACNEIAAWPSPPSQASPYPGYSPIAMQLPFFNVKKSFLFPPSPSFPLFHEIPKSRNPSNSVVNPLKKNVANFSTVKEHNSVQNNFSLSSTPPLRENSPDIGKVVKGSKISLLPSTLCCPSRLYELFARSLEIMWLCWELMVIGEPILVIADTPKGASDAVLAFVELIKPIPFGGDFRPYFTIQDSDFKNIANRNRPAPSSTILGVTNPVFVKLLEHWPHVIRVTKVINRSSNTRNDDPKINSLRPSSPPSSMKSLKQALRGASPTPAEMKPNQVINPAEPSVIQGLQRLTFINTLAPKISFILAPQLNNMLRHHFVELTDRFLQPLNRYFEGLVVGNQMSMTLTTLRGRPEIRPFKQETFLKSIETSTPALSVSLKRSASELYRAFLMSPNFASWLQQKTSEVFREWRRRYLEVICEANILEWARHDTPDPRSEVECVDLLLRIRDELNRYFPYYTLNGDLIEYSNPSTPFNSNDQQWIIRSPSPPRPVPAAIIDRELEQTQLNRPNNFSNAALMSNSGNQSAVNFSASVVNISPKPFSPVQSCFENKHFSNSTSLTCNIENSNKHLNFLRNKLKELKAIQHLNETRKLNNIENTSSSLLNSNKKNILADSSIKSKEGSMGIFIPTVKQYESLLIQFEKLLNLLPQDLRTSVLGHEIID